MQRNRKGGKKNITDIIGIDEAGRGPLAGPVAVGVVRVPKRFSFSYFSVIRDSKQLSERQREAVFSEMRSLQKEGGIDFAVSMVRASVIDKVGIQKAVGLGIVRALSRLDPDPLVTQVLLDGLLRAPEIFPYQRTIVRGDQTEPSISLASIAAKVTRDRYMIKMAKRYPKYGFEQHKGYGTKFHRDALRRHGLCEIHRSSFLNS